jgi:hypothetical protein
VNSCRAEAAQALRESPAIRRGALPDPHVQTGWALNNLATVLIDQRRRANAEPLNREALAMFQKLKNSDPAPAWRPLVIPAAVTWRRS